ncbi:MAG: DinB family protein [Terracidiphilus sp.]|jgi:hypothetical protein
MQFEMNQAAELLSQTPGVLDALLRGKSAGWLHARKTPESFSALDVLGHLIHAENTDWMPRVRIILDHGDTQPFEPFDRFGFRAWIDGKPVGALLNEFAALRHQGLQTLRELGVGEAQLGLPGLHPELGSVTLRELLATWVVHDLNHIAQIVKTMAGEYESAVGSWRPYLSILN